jgi:hypothetical protein
MIMTLTGFSQILAITCDNASNNDRMVDELTDILPQFQGAQARSRCFAHIINLIVKSILQQFEASNTGSNNASIAWEEVQEEEEEEEDNEDEYIEEEGNNMEGWIDE